MRGVRAVVICCVCTTVLVGETGGADIPPALQEIYAKLDETAQILGVDFSHEMPSESNTPWTPRPPNTPRTPRRPNTPRPPRPPMTFGPPQEMPQRPTAQPPWPFNSTDIIEFHNQPLTPKPPACPASLSWVNKQQVKCRGDTIFKDEFEGQTVNSNSWKTEIFMPVDGFMVLTQNTKIVNKKLQIEPKLNPNVNKRIDLGVNKCTKNYITTSGYQNYECVKPGSFRFIAPPVISARLATRISFRYGIIEMRAKLPVGDWIVPHISLEFDGSKGDDWGRITLWRARGNRILIDKTDDKDADISNKVLESLVHIKRHPRTVARKFNPKGWGEEFHNYKMEWTPGSIAFYVDDEEIGKDVLNGTPYYDIVGLQETEKEDYKNGSPMSPFDDNVNLVIGVDVGGLNDFPDDCSNGHDLSSKPWGNGNDSAVFQFWKAKESWQQSWNGSHALQIESIKITAL